MIAMRPQLRWNLVLAAILFCTGWPQRSTVMASPARVDQQVQTALSLDADPENGAKLYGQHCRGCHGNSAEGDALNGIPALAGQRSAYLIRQLANFVELDRQSPEMHRVAAKSAISEPQAWLDIAVYLNALPPTRVAQSGDGTMLSFGEAVFVQWCASCHEEDARGDEDGFVPSLRNQHYSYLLRQMRGFSAGHRLNVEDDLIRFFDSLEADELTAVADYLSRLRGPGRDRAKLRTDGTVTD